jgi:hypothetical protein
LRGVLAFGRNASVTAHLPLSVPRAIIEGNGAHLKSLIRGLAISYFAKGPASVMAADGFGVASDDLMGNSHNWIGFIPFPGFASGTAAVAAYYACFQP